MTLYRVAKVNPGRRFHALRDKIYCRDVMKRVLDQVRRNRGSTGFDKITLADIEHFGVNRLDEGLIEYLANQGLDQGSGRKIDARFGFPKSAHHHTVGLFGAIAVQPSIAPYASHRVRKEESPPNTVES